jgi:hypothetical protein
MMYNIDMDTDKPLQKTKELEVTAEVSKVVPKLTTKVALSKSGNNIILSFLFTLPSEKPQLIERVIFDDNLAKQLSKMINEATESKHE